MIVIYAEKPDMAEKIAFALGGNSFQKNEKKQGYFRIQYKNKEYCVTFGYGHLCGLANSADYNPDYKNWKKMPIPFIPQNYKLVLNLKSSMPVRAAYSVVKDLFQKAEFIINATDYDREGELIFYYLYSYMKCHKAVMRAKLVSTTINGIQEAFEHLLNVSTLSTLLSAARCRAIADWVVGCNLTAAMTLQCGSPGQVYTIGRVQTPTLAMVVKRDQEIAQFRPEDYFVINGIFRTAKGEIYKGIHKNKRFQDRTEAECVLHKCLGSSGVITEIHTEDKIKPVPGLYNLDLLQMDANSRYGFNMKRTLDITQKLYEKGFVTYPRTDSTFLPEDMIEKVQMIQEQLRRNGFGNFFNGDANVSNMKQNRNHYFNDTKIGSHYAIIPTEKNASGLSMEETKVYSLIVEAVIRMLYPPAVISITKITTEVNGEIFLTLGNSIKNPGWLFIHGNMKEEFLPPLKQGETVNSKCNMEAKKTQPPKHYTDKTLLSAMISAGKDIEDGDLRKFMAENKIEGVGTVATRAGILETLISRGVMVRHQKNIVATERGTALINMIPVEVLKSAELTAQYERRLNEIVEGKENANRFLQDMYRDVAQWCQQIHSIPKKQVTTMGQASNTSLLCPVCGSPMYKFKWGYGCTEHKNGCPFTVGSICEKNLTESQLKELFSSGELGPLKDFKRKDGTVFEATLIILPVDTNGEQCDDVSAANYKIEFKKTKSLKNEVPDLYSICPSCSSRIIRGQYGWECEKHCGIKIPYELSGRKIEPEIAEGLLASGSTHILSGFISKKGRPFSAGLKIEGNKIGFWFPEK